jgi:hypothetical protein
LLEGQVSEEDIVVPDANAVIDPRAVVVVPLHATVAYDAVPASACSDHPTLGAEASRVEGLEQLHEVHLVVHDSTSILPGYGDMENDSE